MKKNSFSFLGGKFPDVRPRRMRQKGIYRRLLRETRLSPDQFVMPYFVREGKGLKEPIDSMPGQFRFSCDTLLAELEDAAKKGVRNILLFGVPDTKDEKATEAWSRQGIVQKTLREVKGRFQDLMVITDVCLCAFTNHGHCGVINKQGEIDNDLSLSVLADVALSHAEAGSDMVAPSDMMDGRILAIRRKLDGEGFRNLPILSYAAKYASSFYGPFRDAAHSAPQPEAALSAGKLKIPADRKSYQMDFSNRKEALREIAQDIEEGADMVMIKPALAYLDVIREAAATFYHPLAAFSVSGEYAMIKAAVEKGFADEKALVYEVMTSLSRAGANVLITYYTKDIVTWWPLFS